MKARKLEWTFHAGMGIYYSNDDWDFKIYKTSLELHKGTECIDEFDTIEAAKQAAQQHADKMVADMIDPDLHVLTNEQMLEVIKIAMNEQVKNDLVESITLAPEDVLVKVLLHLEKEKA